MESRFPQTMPAEAARLVAAGVVAVAALAVAIGGVAGALALCALAADFAARATGRSHLSPLAAAARLAIRLAVRRPTPIPAAPKRFAAWLGLAMASAGAALLAMPGAEVAGRGVAVALGAAALLEAAAGFCVGCVVHGWIARTWRRVPECADCVPAEARVSGAPHAPGRAPRGPRGAGPRGRSRAAR
jgi:hypothetical protein